MQCYYSCHTDVGIKKQVNQDAAVVKTLKKQGENYLLAVICDGVGGMQSGEVASATAVREFAKWFDYELPMLLEDEEPLESVLFQRWNAWMNNINRTLVEYGAQQNEKLGTTLSCILLAGNRYYIGHVGDSRIYQITSICEQLTEDQSLVAREIKAGRLTPEQAECDPRRNVILQCIGSMKCVAPDFKKGYVYEDASFLLCTDGFRHQITEEEMKDALGPQIQPEQIKAGLVKLTECAKQRGEKDNITSILIKVFEDDATITLG